MAAAEGAPGALAPAQPGGGAALSAVCGGAEGAPLATGRRSPKRRREAESRGERDAKRRPHPVGPLSAAAGARSRSRSPSAAAPDSGDAAPPADEAALQVKMAAPVLNLQFHHLPRLQGSAKMAGVEYEFKMAGLVALRARAAGLKFRLHSNVRAVRPFDDLVLQVLEPRPALFLVQLKHLNSKKTINAKALTAPSGEFSLRKYLGLFLEPPSSFSHGPPLSAGEEQLQRAMRGEGARLVLYTNGDVERRAAPRTPQGAEDATRALVEGLFRTGSGGAGDVFAFDVTDTEVWQLMKEKGQQKEDSNQQEFLSKFLLFSRQSDADDIDDLISAEIKQLFGGEVPGADRFLERYLKFLKKWAQDDSQSYCLSERSPQLQMERMLADEFRQRARAAAGGFAFGDGACAGLRAALGRSREGVLRVAVPGLPPGLRAAKAQQVLDADFPGAWTYLDSALLEEHPLAALLATCSSCSVVVLDTDEEIHKEQFKNIEESSKTLVILCANDCRVASQSVELDCWRMEDLKKEVQDEMMEKPVLFQGHRVPLRHLEGAWPRLRAEVDGALLAALARGAAELGAALPAPGDESLHVPRKWEHDVLLDPSVLEIDQPTEHLVLSGFGEEHAKELRRRWGVTEDKNHRWTLLATGVAEAAFRKVASKHLWNVHWVHLLRGRTLKDAALQWKATKGEEAALAPFVRTWSAQCVRGPLCAHAGPPWGAGTLLLVGAAGAGKTCALRRAAAETRERAPARWVVFVEILLHLKLLRKLPPVDGIQLGHAVDLLAAAAGAAVPASRRHLEAALAVSGGVSIFIDGVDEVSPFFKDRVLRLLTVLKQNTDNPIWVSCRPEVEASLLQEIGCTATRLCALSREEQRRFLCEQWAAKHHLPASELTAFADKTIDALSEASDGLLDAPLHLSMAAEVLAAETPQLPDTCIQRDMFILLVLYRHFIQRKEDIYLQKHGLKDINWENLNIPDFKNLHQNSAMLALLSDSEDQTENIRNFKTYVEENIQALKKEKSGVLWVDDENNLRFAHFTFAEFFCALWLFEHRVTEQAKELVKYLYLNRSESLAVRFLDLMLVEESRERVQLPLHEALLAGDGAGLARALEEGARADAVDAGGRTALHLAAWRRNWRAMEALLEAGCDAHRPDSLLGWTLMHYAQCFVNPSFLKRGELCTSSQSLLTIHVDLNLCHSICESDCAKVALCLLGASEGCLYRDMLVMAARYNARKVSHSLLTEWDVRACGARGQITEESHQVQHRQAVTDATWEALIREHEELALELIDHVSDVHKLIWNGESALHLAARRFLIDITKRLLKKVEYACVRDNLGRAPLHGVFTSKFGRVQYNAKQAHYVQHFLEMVPISMRQDHTNARDNEGRTPLHLAVQAGNLSGVEKLLAYGSDANAADNNKNTPLHVAMKKELKEDANMVKLLLDHGADPSLIDLQNQQPLSYLYNPHCPRPTEEIAKEVVTALLEKQADPNCRNFENKTLLHLAVAFDHLQIVRLLLKYGEHTKGRNENAFHPLYYAKSSGAVNLEVETANDAAALRQHEHPLSATHVRDEKGLTPLHVAASRGNVEAMRALMTYGADPNSGDNAERTPLHLAAQKNSADAVKLLIEAGSHPAARDKMGQGPLNYVYKNAGPLTEDRESTVALLLEKGSCPHTGDQRGWTPLHHAVYNGHTKIVERLLKSGAFANVCDVSGRLPLHYAGSAYVVSLLLRNVIRSAEGDRDVLTVSDCENTSPSPMTDADARDNEGRSSLHLAADRGNVDVVKALVSSGSAVNAKDGKGLTPLHLATGNDYVKVMKFLVASDADTNSADNEGRTPLHLAAERISPDAVRLLIETQSDPAAQDHKGQAPLNYVYKRESRTYKKDRDSIVALLLQEGSPPNIRDESGRTPLHHAVRYDHKKVAERLLAHNAFVDVADYCGRLPLHCARSAGAVALLLGDGAGRRRADGERAQGEAAPPPRAADANAPDAEGRSPLHLAAIRGERRAAKALVAAGSDPNARDCDGRTPLHMAVGWENVPVVRLLLDAGARYDALDNRGRAPLNYLCVDDYIKEFRKRNIKYDPAEENFEIVRIFEMMGCKEDCEKGDYDEVDSEEECHEDKSGKNFRETSDRARIAALLLGRGVDPSSRDESGRTALHHAALEADLPLVRVLLQHRADVELLDNRGQTARDLAQEGRRLMPRNAALLDKIFLLLNV